MVDIVNGKLDLEKLVDIYREHPNLERATLEIDFSD